MAKKQKASKEDFQNDIGEIFDDAIQFADGELTDQRTKAKEYYNSEKLGNEEPGRSQFVVSEVRDGVVGVIPSILRVLFGAEKPVEFVPRNATQSAQADQITDYITQVFEMRGGFMQSYSVLKDGLVGKMGIFKYWWDDTSTVTAHKIEGIEESKLEMLVQEEGVELTRVEGMTPPVPPTKALLGPDGQPAGPDSPGAEATYLVEFTHTETNGAPNFAAIPPEEFIFNRSARSREDAQFLGHRTHKTTGELLAMGVTQADIDEHGGADERLKMGIENQARVATLDQALPDVEVGEANKRHLYIEGYVRYDFDGDNIAELRRVCTLGLGYFVISNDPVEEAPFALFSPDPEPHTIVGKSWADRLMDLQRVKSMLTRSMLDSLALSIFNRIGYVEGDANVDDILNNEIGAPIRMKTINGILPISHEFKGKEAFPMLDYFDQIGQKRTGRLSNGAALDSDALQSSTKSAVGAAITGAQEQTELLARFYAEETLKPLFRGLMKLFIEHQPRAHTTRLRGKWVDIDPRMWDADMDVSVKVALGQTMVEQKVAILDGLLAKQELIISTLGITNPLFTLAHYGNTIKKALNLQGFMDTREFMNDVPPDWQPPQQEPQESEAQVLAKATLEVEKMKTEKELAMKAAEFEFKKQQHADEMEMKLRQMELDAELKKYEIDSKMADAAAARDMDAQASNIEADIAAIRSDREEAIAEEEREDARAVADHDQMMLQEQHELDLQQQTEAHEKEMSAPVKAASE